MTSQNDTRLAWGYNPGLPAAGLTAAWGCRAIIDADGYIDVPHDRQSAVGARRDVLLTHLTHHVGRAWRDRAAELVRNGVMFLGVARELVLYRDDRVVIKGNTLASHGYLYVCAYLRADGGTEGGEKG